MFREMRRIRQQISTEECEEILRRATSGVLGVYGDDGYPYTVPLSFVYESDGNGHSTIHFHCAKTGPSTRADSVTLQLCVETRLEPQFLPPAPQ